VTDRLGGWFQTWSGRRFYPADPRVEDVCLGDIAHALARICRFNGHVRDTYSVAQHCVLVSELVLPDLALHGLLHDAAEAYTGDLIAPMKRALRTHSNADVSAYDHIEQGVERVIREWARLPELNEVEAARVKHADLRALATERRDLLQESGHVWDSIEQVAPDPRTLRAMSAVEAEARFLDRYWALRAREIAS
jgi:5'-deoxynucleotidase YfbR-like HD superfamily hydrolase